MDIYKSVVNFGTGLTVAVLAAAFVSYLVEPMIEFSVFIGIPVGFIAGVGAMAVAGYLMDRNPQHKLMTVLPALATFGYILIGLYLIRVLVPIARQTLRPNWILVIAVIAAVAAFVYHWITEPSGSDLPGGRISD